MTFGQARPPDISMVTVTMFSHCGCQGVLTTLPREEQWRSTSSSHTSVLGRHSRVNCSMLRCWRGQASPFVPHLQGASRVGVETPIPPAGVGEVVLAHPWESLRARCGGVGLHPPHTLRLHLRHPPQHTLLHIHEILLFNIFQLDISVCQVFVFVNT